MLRIMNDIAKETIKAIRKLQGYMDLIGGTRTPLYLYKIRAPVYK